MDITFERIVEANEKMRLTSIQDKGYAEVPQRVKGFRFLYPEGTIETELVSNENGVCVFKALVKDETGKILSTGTAYEKEGAGFINKTSYIENCETSAVGRALGFLGLGIDTSIASFEEVANAKEQQKQAKKKTEEKVDPVEEADAKAKVMAYINRHQMSSENIAKICELYNVESIQKMTLQMCKHYISALQKQGGNINE